MLDFISPKCDHISVLKHQVDKRDYAGMRGFISSVEWDKILTVDSDVDSWWDKISSNILTAIEHYVPKKSYRQKVLNAPLQRHPLLLIGSN